MADITNITLDVLRLSLPLMKNAVAIKSIHKGYSTDKKVIVHLQDDTKLLLRLFDLNEYEQKCVEYDYLRIIESYGVKCSKPLACGKLADLLQGYMLLTYIEGNDASEELPKLTETEQYQIGFETGNELLKMHQFAAAGNVSPWHERKIVKHHKLLSEYAKLNVPFTQDSKIISFIDEHIYLMQDRPNLFQHDDIHVGNIIVKDRNFAGIIDFNRYDWGDPVHDFLKMAIFSKEISIPFSIGQVKGYHLSTEPDELFWKLYALYLAMSFFASIVWVWKFVPDEKESLLGKLALVLEDHNNFDSYKPNWYK
jgi:aminoglycoside phosphotransferase (APT) family kinase protein